MRLQAHCSDYDAGTMGLGFVVFIEVSREKLNGDKDMSGIISHDLMTEIMGVVPVFGGKKVTVGFYSNMAFASEALNYINVS